MQTETAVQRAKRLDREIAAAGGLAAYWQANAPAEYRTLIDPTTGAVVAVREVK